MALPLSIHVHDNVFPSFEYHDHIVICIISELHFVNVITHHYAEVEYITGLM